MSAVHLLWIIPAAAFVGFLWAALLAVGGSDDEL